MSDVADAKLKEFIDEYLPGYVEKTEPISGGFMNYTFRLCLKPELPSLPSDKPNNPTLLVAIHQLKPETLIVKMAFPYLAGTNGSTPFTTDRQRIEENSLKMFNDMPLQINGIATKLPDLQSASKRTKTVRISNVWFRDEVNNILLMDDHGSLPTVTKWFTSEKKETSSNQSIVTTAQQYGEELANFLLDMQISSLPYLEQLESLFQNREIHDSLSVVLAAGVDIMRNAGKLPDADEVFSIANNCLQHDWSRASQDGKVYSHGDYDVQNMLINERNATIGVVDWEIAAIRSPAHDPALFLARARIPLEYHPTNEALLKFINRFADVYREGAKKKGVSWYQNEREQYLFAWYLATMYGTMLLYCTLIEPCCSGQIGVCCHKNNLVEHAVNSIRHCRSGPTKDTYDAISHDPFLGRLFQASHEN